MQSMEGQFDSCTEQLFDVTTKLEIKDKNLSSAEGDVGSLSRRVLLLEEEVERSEERLAKAVTNLSRLPCLYYPSELIWKRPYFSAPGCLYEQM